MNTEVLNGLIEFIRSNDGINDKDKLALRVNNQYKCVRDRSVYYTHDFAIRFCKAFSATFSNTVLSLSALQKYDDRSFIVCVCTPLKNYMLLSNSTFLSKISHSSMKLRIDNIKGSFNGSDIIRQVDCIKGTIKNIPENFDVLFGIHQNIPFEDNLARLVEATNGIVPTGKRFDVSVGERQKRIMNAPKRAIAFSNSTYYSDLLTDLNDRTSKYENEISAPRTGILSGTTRGE